MEMITTLVGSVIFTSTYSTFINLYPGFIFTVDGIVYIIAFILVSGFAYQMHRDLRLNLLYNTLDYPDYGSSNNNITATKSEPEEEPPAILEKRLSRISEDGVERMTISNSKWKRNDSSSTDASAETPQEH